MTAVVPIAGKAGQYRHPPTGFIVQDVRSLDDVLDCNGVLVDNIVTGDWLWLAGRDLRDAIIDKNIVGIAGFLTLKSIDFGLHAVVAGSRAQVRRVPFESSPLHGGGAPYVDAWTRVFGLRTGVDAGFGTSINYDAEAYAPSIYSVGITTTTSNVATMIGKLGQNGAGSFVSPDWTASMHTPAPNCLGAALIRMPTGYTWAETLEQLLSSVPNQDHAEVQARIVDARAKVKLVWEASGHLMTDKATFNIATLIRANGDVAYIPPQTNWLSGSEYVQHGYNGGGCQMAREMGSRNYTATGRGITMPPQIFSSVVNSTPNIGGIYGQKDGDFVITPAASAAVAAGFTTFTHLDGVRLERVFGGLMGSKLSDTGEQTIPSALPLVSSSVLAAYLAAIKIRDADGTVSSPTPSIPISTVSGLPMTASEMIAYATTTYGNNAQNDCSEILLTQYDTHMMSIGHLVVLFTLAMDPGKAQWGTFMGFAAACGAGTAGVPFVWASKFGDQVITGMPELSQLIWQ